MARLNRPWSVWLLLALMGCRAAVQPPPLVSATRSPEARALPPDPAEEPLPPGTPPEETIEPLEAGSCYDGRGLRSPAAVACPSNSGLLVSEGRAVRDGFYRIRYRELRTLYVADRTTWSAHRELYEALRVRDQAEIQRLQPSFLDRYGLAVGLTAGFLLGVGGTLALALSR